MQSSEGFVAGMPPCRRPDSLFSAIRTRFAAGLLALFLMPIAAQAADIPMTLEGGISATLNMPDSTEPVPAVLLHEHATVREQGERIPDLERVREREERGAPPIPDGRD